VCAKAAIPLGREIGFAAHIGDIRLVATPQSDRRRRPESPDDLVTNFQGRARIALERVESFGPLKALALVPPASGGAEKT
jgi:hypothetical protein